jgi:hypothetical protein
MCINSTVLTSKTCSAEDDIHNELKFDFSSHIKETPQIEEYAEGELLVRVDPADWASM